jgi:hypothetical protein
VHRLVHRAGGTIAIDPASDAVEAGGAQAAGTVFTVVLPVSVSTGAGVTS